MRVVHVLHTTPRSHLHAELRVNYSIFHLLFDAFLIAPILHVYNQPQAQCSIAACEVRRKDSHGGIA
jgi:hypothetical protein